MSDPNDLAKPPAKTPTRTAKPMSEEEAILGLGKEYGCLGGTALAVLVPFLGFGVPAMIVCAIFFPGSGSIPSMGRSILALFVWALLSVASLLGQAWFIETMRSSGEGSVTTDPGVFGNYVASDPRLRNLTPDAKAMFFYLGGTSKRLKRLILRPRGFRKTSVFRDEPHSLEELIGELGNVSQGSGALKRAREAAEALVAARLAWLDGNSIGLTGEGIAVHLDMYRWQKRRRGPQ